MGGAAAGFRVEETREAQGTSVPETVTSTLACLAEESGIFENVKAQATS